MKNYDVIKSFCRRIYFIGSGNYWFEDDTIGSDETIHYRLLSGILYSIYTTMTLLEVLAAVCGDFPLDEKRDSVTLAVSHAIVVIKFYLVMSNKKFVKILNKKMVTTCEAYEEQELMARKYKIIKMNIIAYFASVYSSVSCFILEGLWKYFKGSHFVTVVTYYPSFEDNSGLATAFRIFWTIALVGLMMNMIVSVDGVTVAHLVMYKYKFITLRHYFDNLNEDFLKLNKTNRRLASERLYGGLVEGIVMHKELLSVAEDFDNAFGSVIALQLLLSSGTAVSLLLQVALTYNLSFVGIMKMLFFVAALFILLAVFLCNAGEIMYQASLINEAIFYCGWHESVCLRPPHRNARKLVLMACVQAQRPLIMKAFKMVELSYATFIQVVRLTYSVFALFYAQNK